jgi:hypothetical protein
MDVVGQAILPADAFPGASEPARKLACSQDWLPQKLTHGQVFLLGEIGVCWPKRRLPE